MIWLCACRHSYVEGRLRLAEKERQRLKSRNAAGGAQTGPSEEDLASLEAQANANMAALLEEEEVKKVPPMPAITTGLSGAYYFLFDWYDVLVKACMSAC
jgi:hypothetical protein